MSKGKYLNSVDKIMNFLFYFLKYQLIYELADS